MDEQLYQAAWGAVEPIMDEYLSGRGRFEFSTPRSQENYNKVHAEYIAIRNAALIPFGVTFDQIAEENERRLDLKYSPEVK